VPSLTSALRRGQRSGLDDRRDLVRAIAWIICGSDLLTMVPRIGQ
jgi:hypothetical protein